MNRATYKRHRAKLGTQEHAAGLLGVTRLTIIRREAGQLPITREAALAIERLTTTVRARGPRNTEVRDGGLPPFSGPTG